VISGAHSVVRCIALLASTAVLDSHACV